MSTVITLALPGLLVSVSPSTIVVFILLLATMRARTNAAAFLIGWSISLIIVFAVSYAVGGARAVQHGSGRTAVEVIEILLGAALAVAAARQWRHRDQPRTSSGVAKKFTARLKRLNPWEALLAPGSTSVGCITLTPSITSGSARRTGRPKRLRCTALAAAVRVEDHPDGRVAVSDCVGQCVRLRKTCKSERAAQIESASCSSRLPRDASPTRTLP